MTHPSANAYPSQKANGAYYTPESVVAKLVRWAVRRDSDRLLDPACGDGRFVAAHRNSFGVEQIFDYDVDAMEFRPGADRDLCLVVGAESRTAGPFMSRSLELAPCALTDAARKQWRVKGGRS